MGRLPTRGDFDGGVDVKYGITTGLVWDFTVNTDFSQVEADEQQVNLTRFSLFFPEKRDFFLENAGVFDFGSTSSGYFGGFGSSSCSRQNDGSLDQRFNGFHLPLEFSNGGFAEVGVNTYVEVIAVPFTLNSARGAIVTPSRYPFTESFALFNGDPSATVAPAVRYSLGRFYDGYKRSYAFGPSVRLNEKLSASLNLQINDIELPGVVAYVSTLATARVNYNFSTNVFLNALVPYTTDTAQLSSNVRFNIIHRPLSDFFFVYNERRDERTNLRLDRALIAKFTYMLAL